MPQYDDSQRSRNGLSSEKDVQNSRCTQRRGYTPVWHATANLNPLEMAERDSTSLERRSAESSGIMVSEANKIYLDRVMETITDM